MKPLHVRLAAWGTVLVLAVVAFNLRVGAADDVDQGANGPQLNGHTSQRQPIWAVLEDGRVREIRMVWELRCDDGTQLDPLGITVRSSVDGFDERGRTFAFADRRELPGTGGKTAHVDVRVQGGPVRGTAAATVELGAGRPKGTTCRSGPVRWSLSR